MKLALAVILATTFIGNVNAAAVTKPESYLYIMFSSVRSIEAGAGKVDGVVVNSVFCVEKKTMDDCHKDLDVNGSDNLSVIKFCAGTGANDVKKFNGIKWENFKCGSN